MIILKTKMCPVCDKEFQPTWHGQIHCNIKCYSLSPKLKEYAKNSKLITELTKNNTFRLGSHPESNSGSFKKGFVPWNKGKEVDYIHPTSWKKQDDRITGPNNFNWKGGDTGINKLIRGMPEMIQWRSDIFQRDNWICQTCQRRGVVLEAHHKVLLRDIIKNNNIVNIAQARSCKELWDINNGVTLCYDCHNLTKGKDSEEILGVEEYE